MKYIYIIIGCLCFGLGTIGAVLPILPTTPFLLVASFCFAKGSTRFHTWFTNTKLYEKHLKEFVASRSMTRESKRTILAFASAMLILAFLLVGNLHARIAILFVIAFKYYYFLFRIKTISGETTYDD